MTYKFFLILLVINFFSFNSNARETGQTEITAEEGIEVFQNEKYYLLKKDVDIISDNFQLKADLVKAYFDKDLYDIIKIESEGNVKLKSKRGLVANGNIINFSTKEENISVYGKNSSLIYGNINMYSEEIIKVNNISGKFYLKGPKSELKTDSIQIFGNIIDGMYLNIEGVNEVQTLYVEDKTLANIITETMNMFALKGVYNKKDNIIELFDNVKVIRGEEIITGDYANIDTLNDSYKIKSKNKKKVKALIINTDE